MRIKTTTYAMIGWLLLFCTNFACAVELVIGEVILKPGIELIFEGAVKDDITPSNYHLEEAKTDVHIEARVNWATENIPVNAPQGGFVPYMVITAEVTNVRTGDLLTADLVPHINLIDNFHYARNIALPGKITDKYDVIFRVMPPAKYDLSYHKDWRQQYGNQLFEAKEFRFKDIDFEEIARATR